MKPKYSIGEVVRLKKPNNKVLLRIERHDGEFENDPMYLCRWIKYPNTTGLYYQWQLKPYRPSRTGTRDPKTGRFVSKDFYGYNFTATEIQQQKIKNTRMNNYLDSKQRNYQKIEKFFINDLLYVQNVPTKEILIKINEIIENQERIEKKIDELGRKV